MLNKGNLCSNKFENFQAIRGETVKGVLELQSTYLIVFESGYSLEINTNSCAYWINDPSKTLELITIEKNRRSNLIENLAEVTKLLER